MGRPSSVADFFGGGGGNEHVRVSLVALTLPCSKCCMPVFHSELVESLLDAMHQTGEC